MKILSIVIVLVLGACAKPTAPAVGVSGPQVILSEEIGDSVRVWILRNHRDSALFVSTETAIWSDKYAGSPMYYDFWQGSSERVPLWALTVVADTIRWDTLESMAPGNEQTLNVTSWFAMRVDSVWSSYLYSTGQPGWDKPADSTLWGAEQFSQIWALQLVSDGTEVAISGVCTENKLPILWPR